MEWTSVEERWPKKFGRYLVTLNRPIVDICRFKNSQWYLDKKDVTEYVTHWMALPEPPTC